MARRALVSLIAPYLVSLSACVAASTTHVTHEPAQIMRAPDVGEPAPEPPALPDFVPPPPPLAEPEHAVEEKVEPKSPATPVKSFTRDVDRVWLETRGAPGIDARIDAAALRAAAARNNAEWSADERRELLAFLRERILDRNRRFIDADARLIAQLQAGSGGSVDGVLGDETMAILFAAGFRFSARKAMPWEVKLEFYPGELEDLDTWNREIEEKVTKNGGGFHDVTAPEGEGVIYVHRGRSLVARYRARGGPPAPLLHGDHTATPTTPGAYRLGPAHAHVTSNWYYSQIPWGAEIRKSEDGYQYRIPGRTTWSWGTRHPAGALKDPIAAGDFEDLPEVTRGAETYRLWNKNDFGPVAWNLVASDQYVHTTPYSEAESADAEPGAPPPELGFSHGCIHIDPRERDEMMARGYLGKDVRFVVRRWDEHLLPNGLRREMINGTAVTFQLAGAVNK